MKLLTRSMTFPAGMLVAALLWAATTTSTWGATTISSLPTGLGNIATRSDFGQSFIVPTHDSYLSSFSAYFFSSGGPVTYATSIYLFNPTISEVEGSAIYTGTVQTAPVVANWPPFPETTFNFPSPLALTPNADLLFVFDQQDYTNVFRNFQFSATDNYANGRMFISNGAAPYTGSSWSLDSFDSNASIGFSAVFVPEPACASLLFVIAPSLLARRLLRKREQQIGKL